MAYQKKQLLINVFDSSGVFITTWKEANFLGFSKELNAGIGECVIILNENFDYDGTDLKVGNDVELRISDRDTISIAANGTGVLTNQDTANSKIIYFGYISLIERKVDGGKEQVMVHILGHYTKLAIDILKNATQTTLYSRSTTGLTVTVADIDPADIGLMARTVIDRYRAETVNPRINYLYEDIPDLSVVATYSFKQKTYREALDILKKMAPAGVYYYVDETGNVKFKSFATTTPKHKFVFGKHFNSVEVQESMEKVRNFLLVWNGETGASEVYKHYQDDGSIAEYGRRAEAVNDYGVDNVNAADLIGTKFLSENKQPEVKVNCSIIDNAADPEKGYDIESIQPGDTCSFYGFKDGVADIFRENMLITKVVYYLDKVDIEVQAVKSGLQDFQDQQGRAIGDIGTGGLGIVEIYT